MANDLLSTIRAEVQERMEELWPVVSEHERLQADLRALEAEHGARAEAFAGLGAPVPVPAPAPDLDAPHLEALDQGAPDPVSDLDVPGDAAGILPAGLPHAGEGETMPVELPPARPPVSPKVLRLMGAARPTPVGRRATRVQSSPVTADEAELAVAA